MKTWRLLDTPPMTAAQNMALDDTLLELKASGGSPDTIRFLQFSPPAVLVGYHQSVAEEVRSVFCRDNGIHINRRITGGGAILFDESQIGWEIICDKSFFNVGIPTPRVFRELCEPVVTALGQLGLHAGFRPRNDIEIDGRKISGTGGTESDGAFLFQGTLLVDFDVHTMIKALKIPVEKLKAKEIDSIKERVTCLNWELGCTPPPPMVKAAIRAGFERHFHIRLEPGELTPAEKKRFEDRLSFFQSPAWIEQVQGPAIRQDVIQAAYKSEAGLIRCTLVVHLPAKRIKEIYITGDFLSFPPRALYDLESALRGARLDRKRLAGIVEGFFAQGKIMIPGMDARDFLKPLDQALDKIAVSEFGIPIAHCNRISVTNGSFRQILEKRPTVLLLPYCSKLTRCDLRFEKGCRACGECSIGPAWRIGLERRMKPVCIVSFEDLRLELEKMRAAGEPAFIGCCCEPFFTKHVDDFRAAGVPGILLTIDNTTCYDLDQAKAAYAGKFESQTHINMDLLRTVIGALDRAAP